MAKRHKTCERKLIRFKKKRGGVVQFYGRSAGSTRHGGECKPKAPTSAQRAQRRALATAARACRRQVGFKGSPHAAIARIGKCVAQKLAA